jgi:hypothetical protein
MAVIEDKSGIGAGTAKKLREEQFIEDVRRCYKNEVRMISLQLMSYSHQLRLLRERRLSRGESRYRVIRIRVFERQTEIGTGGFTR